VMDWGGHIKLICRWLKMQDRLYNEAGISLSMGRVLATGERLGMRLKKSHSTRPSGNRSQPQARRTKIAARIQSISAGGG